MAPKKTLVHIRRKPRRHEETLEVPQNDLAQAGPTQQMQGVSNQAVLRMLDGSGEQGVRTNGSMAQPSALQRLLADPENAPLQGTLGNQARLQLIQRSGGTIAPVQREGDLSFQDKLKFFQSGGGQSGTSTLPPKDAPKNAPGAMSFWKNLEQTNAKPPQDGVGGQMPTSEAPSEETLPEPKSVESVSEKPNKSYETKQLLSHYRETEKRSHQKGKGFAYWEGNEKRAKVKYLETDEERKKYELDFDKENNFFRWQGKLFDTTKMEAFDSRTNEQGRAIFVMSSSGKLYAADQGAEIEWRSGWTVDTARNKKQYAGGMIALRFNHSSFFAGEPIAAAGEMIFEKGELKTITDASGHYQPGLKETLQVLDALKRMGAKLDNIVVERFGSKPILAKDLLEVGERPNEQFFMVVQKLVGQAQPNAVLELLEQAAKLSTEMLQKLPALAEYISLMAFRNVDAISDFTDSLEKLTKEDVGLAMLRANRTLAMVERAKSIFGNAVDDKLVTELRTLKVMLERPRSGGDEKEQLESLKGEVVDSFHGIRKLSGIKKGKVEKMVGKKGAAIGEKLEEQAKTLPGLRNDYQKVYDQAESAIGQSKDTELVRYLSDALAINKDLFPAAFRAAAKKENKDKNDLEKRVFEISRKGGEDAPKAAAILESLGFAEVRETEIDEAWDEIFDDIEEDYLRSASEELWDLYKKGKQKFREELLERIKGKQTLEEFIKQTLLEGIQRNLDDAEKDDDERYLDAMHFGELANWLVPGTVPESDIDDWRSKT